MRLFSIGMSLLIVASLFANCGGRNNDEEEKDDTDTLYYTTLKLIDIYTDSLRQATDSATAAGSFNHFQQELDSLNRAVDADTDLLLTPGQNDTIYKKLTKLLDLYESKREIRPLMTDSVAEVVEGVEELEE